MRSRLGSRVGTSVAASGCTPRQQRNAVGGAPRTLSGEHKARRCRRPLIARLSDHLIVYCIALAAREDRGFGRYRMLCLVRPCWHNCIHVQLKEQFIQSQQLLDEPDMLGLAAQVRAIQEQLDAIVFDPTQLDYVADLGNRKYTMGAPQARYSR